MTQAFNLSQLANNLNTSGQLDATDGLTGVVPLANGGTGTTNTVNSIVAGTNITTSVSGTAVTINASSSAPTTAQVVSAYVGISAGGVGAYATTYQPTVNAGIGATIAGSTLRGINSSGTAVNPSFGGTWRVVGCSDANTAGYTGGATLVLRIS